MNSRVKDGGFYENCLFLILDIGQIEDYMLLLRWLFLTHPVLRLFSSCCFPFMLLFYPWLSPSLDKWGGFLAAGFIQSISAAFLSAGIVLLFSSPFYVISSSSNKKLKLRHHQLLSDINFVSKILWPHRVLSFSLVIGSFFYFHDLSDIESIIILAITVLQFINYFKKRDNLSQGLDLLFFVESGIILTVSSALGLIISFCFLIFMTVPSEIPSWDPMDDRGLRFLIVFCAAIQSFYQIYLTGKLNKMADILKGR